MSLTLVQNPTPTPYNNPSSSPATTTVSQAFASANTAGNLLIAVVSVSGANTVNGETFTDSAGNTWVTIDDNVVASFSCRTSVYFCASCVGGANTATYSWTWAGLGGSYNSTNETTIQLFEYSGAPGTALQATSSSTGTSVALTDSRGATDTITSGGHSGSTFRAVLFDLANGSTDFLFLHTFTTVAPGSITLSGSTGLTISQVASVHATVSGTYLTFYTLGTLAGRARGNIDYDQIRASVRKGKGGLIQMAGASTYTSGNLPKFDADGNLIDSGSAAPASAMNNPMTTPGDIIVGGASGAPARLAKGADGTVLTMVSGAEAWVAPSGASVMVASGPSHAAGLAPDPGATAGTTKFLREDATWAVPAGGGGSFQPSSLSLPPTLATFTWVNQGSATASQNGSAIAMTIPGITSLNWRILKVTAPSTPYSIAAFWKSAMYQHPSATSGLYFYDGTKLMGIELLIQGAGAQALRVERINSVTSDNSSVSTTTVWGGTADALSMPLPITGGFYGRLRNNGTTLFVDFSLDGENWTNLYSEAVGAFTTPTAYGWGGVAVPTSGTFPMIMSLQGWLATGSATL